MFPTTCKLPVISTFEPSVTRSSPSNWSFGFVDNTLPPSINGIRLESKSCVVIEPVSSTASKVASDIVVVH